MVRAPSTSPYPHRLPDGRRREAGEAQRKTDRVRTMFSSPGESDPANPQEGREFNKQKSNSKARIAPSDERAEPDRVEEDRRADHSAAGEDAAGTGTPGGRGDQRDRRDQRPVPDLQATKARRPAQPCRTAGEPGSTGRSRRPPQEA